MRLDPKGTIRGYPTLLVRSTLRCLRGDLVWGEEALETAAKLTPGTGRALAQAPEAEGLIEASRHGGWTVTQAGDTLAVATAARPVLRHTAERALTQFLERVARVNVDRYFLARVERVALYGSLLRPEVKRLSDVDLAVQLVAKETDFERLREANAKRVEQLANLGKFFGSFLQQQFCWFLETFRFLKGGSRVISLADYNVEKRLVLAGSASGCCSGSPRSSRRNLRRKQPPRRRGGEDRGTARSEARERSKYDNPTFRPSPGQAFANGRPEVFLHLRRYRF